MLNEGTRRFGLAFLGALLMAITILPFRTALAEAAPGENAPAFSLKLLDGKVLNSKALRGHPVVIRFLASW